MVDINLDDLENVPTKELSEEDKNKFDGVKTKIARIEIKEKDTKWKDGKELPEGQTTKTMVAVAETESIGLDSLGQDVIVREEFPLKKHPVSGKWGPSMHEKAKGKKLFNRLKVNTFKECIGKDVTIVKKISEANPSRSWLGILV